MIKYEKRCKVCQIIKLEGGDSSQLLSRIYNSRQFLPDGEALTEIQADHDPAFGYLSLYNHAKKHQTMTQQELDAKQINHLETKVQQKRLEALTTSQFRDRLKAKAAEKLERDEVKGWTVSSIAKVLKDEDDVAAKQKDQQIKVLGMIEGFQSGMVKLTTGDRKVVEVEDYSVLPEPLVLEG